MEENGKNILNEISQRIHRLQEDTGVLEGEVRILQGRSNNCDPTVAENLRKENQDLRARSLRLEKALFALYQDIEKPRRPDEAMLQFDMLRLAAIEFFQHAKVDPEIWKSLEY